MHALSPVMTLLAYNRRLTASLAALAISRHGNDLTAPEQLAPLITVAAPVLEDLADALARERPPRPLPHPGAFAPSSEDPILRARLERIARQIQTLHEAARRWEAGEQGAAAGVSSAREVA